MYSSTNAIRLCSALVQRDLPTLCASKFGSPVKHPLKKLSSPASPYHQSFLDGQISKPVPAKPSRGLAYCCTGEVLRKCCNSSFHHLSVTCQVRNLGYNGKTTLPSTNAFPLKVPCCRCLKLFWKELTRILAFQ